MQTKNQAFAEQVDSAMRQMRMSADRIARVTDKQIPKGTLVGWRTAKHAPQRWDQVLLLARVLERDRQTVNEWLTLTGHPSLDYLRQQLYGSLEQRQRELIDFWLEPSETMSALTVVDPRFVLENQEPDLYPSNILQVSSQCIAPATEEESQLFGNCRDNGQVEAVLPQFIEERPHQEAAYKSAHSFSTAIPKEPESHTLHTFNTSRTELRRPVFHTLMYVALVTLAVVIVGSLPLLVFRMRLDTVSQHTIVTVQGVDHWRSSGITVHEGQTIDIAYRNGTWTPGRQKRLVDSAGYTNEYVEWSILPTAPLGSLVMRIGTATPIAVGRTKMVASGSGVLSFQMNDGNCACYGDNEGAVEVGVTVSP